MLHRAVPWIVGIVFLFMFCQVAASPESLAASTEGLEDTGLEYLYINKKMVNETEKKIAFFRELLPGGRVAIAGRAAGSAKVKAIEVSIDGKGTWRKVKVAHDNTFRYSFKAQKGTTYGLFIRITNAKGDTNNIDSTFKGITILDRSLYNAVRDVLDNMIDAYQGKASGSFMSHVNDSFTGEKVEYDRSIRNDFSTLHDISIRYNLNNVTPDYKDKVFVSLNFNRSYTVIKTGRRSSDEGSTAMIFTIDNGRLSLYSVRGQPLFGFTR
jgi:hypothetical protein